MNDIGASCADIADTRACWNPDGSVVRVPRPLPSPEATRGFRCAGTGAERKCEDRAWGSDAFSCNGDRCTQKFPRLPDDNEWECADLDGVVVCHGGGTAAGIVAGAPDPAFICGPHRGKETERVCVDFSPDRPEGEPFNCRFQYEPGVPRRACVKGGQGPLGRACGSGCPFGSACSGDRCLPLRPEPACWLDRDCGQGMKCAHGTCREAPK